MVKHIYHLTHNLKVVGSNPTPATIKTLQIPLSSWMAVFLCPEIVSWSIAARPPISSTLGLPRLSPDECKSLPELTITHDPAGAFDRRVKGLVIAGHTHCGQVSLPFIGPLWVPTDAPSFAHCGLHEGGNITVFVTSGVGTSIIPLRFGAQSQWDLILLKVNKWSLKFYALRDLSFIL